MIGIAILGEKTLLALRITDIKQIMRLLLDKNETAFDSFLLSEASFTTNAQMTIDGHFHPEFYQASELEDLKREALEENRIFSEKMIRWAQVKSQCFDFIKGTHTPLGFKISLYLADENIEKFLARTDTQLGRNDVAGLSMTLQYDGSELRCTSGTSLNLFTMDKSINVAWDNMVKKFFDRWEIGFEEL